jgi:hypothetical protein
VEKRICKKCNNSYPLNKENFPVQIKDGRMYFYYVCKECKRYEDSIRYKEKKLKAEIAKDEAWKDPFRDKIFICKHCGEKKNFDQMRVNATNKAMDSKCKACYNKKSKEYKENYDANCFIRSQKKGAKQ